MSGLPDFVPPKAPGHTVTDLSGSLNGSQLATLDKLGKDLSYHARVLIMPKTYKAVSSEELRSLTETIGREWKVGGDRLLMVVDLQGHKIQIVAGDNINVAGVNNTYLQRTVLQNYFYPLVRKGDVNGAVTSSLTAINERMVAYRRTNTGTASQTTIIQPQSSTLSGGDNGGSSMLWMGGGLVALAVAIYFVVQNANKDKNRRLNKSLSERLGKLYTTANELGQASEYIAPKSNKDLALKVSAFFEKLSTLDKAKEEIEKFSASKRWGKANEGLLPALKMSDSLNKEGEDLLDQVSAITGGVDSLKPDKAIEAQEPGQKDSEESDKPHKIKINMDRPYARPSWSYNQEYNQPLFINTGYSSSGGIFDMMYLLNQMDTNRRLDNLEYSNWSGHSNNYNSGNYSGGNASTDNSYSVDSGGDWGNSGSSSGSFSTDTGGDWGSSSSDFGSSDSGSSDSGSSDSGGSW